MSPSELADELYGVIPDPPFTTAKRVDLSEWLIDHHREVVACLRENAALRAERDDLVRRLGACIPLGSWMSAALDEKCCQEFRTAVEAFLMAIDSPYAPEPVKGGVE